MSLISHYKNQSKISFEPKSTLKYSYFLIANCLLMQSEDMSSTIYHFFLFLEHLGILWFILHPSLAIYSKAYLLDEFRVALKILNFQELMQGVNATSKIVIIIIFCYLLLQILAIVFASYAVLTKNSTRVCKNLRKFLNLQYLFNIKVLSGPFIGLIINFIYCKDGSPYNIGQLCYQGNHLALCFLCGIILIIIVGQILLFGLFYFIQNPFSQSFLADHNRNYTLTKFVIKILLTTYFAVDFHLSMKIIFCYLTTFLLGFYIFFHRFSSTHSYNQKNFYFEYFLESFLFWASANNILLILIQRVNIQQPMTFIYSIGCIFFISILMVNIEKKIEKKFIQECLEKKIKKQNMERFVFIFISLTLHHYSKQSKIIFRIYSSIIIIDDFHNNLQIEKQKGKKEIYHFLLRLINSYIKEYGSPILKIIRCHILYILGSKCYSIHQSLQILQQKLKINEEFMVFQFNRNHNFLEQKNNQKSTMQFVQFYQLNEQIQSFEGLIQIFAQSNVKYWNQLSQPQSSFPNLQYLANNCQIYYQKIACKYQTIIELFPRNISSTYLYLNFLLTLGTETLQVLKIRQNLQKKLQSQSKSIQSIQYELLIDQKITIITINTQFSQLGIILNCNKYIKESLGFTKIELIGSNITKIMPKIYGNQHNNWLNKFIKGQSSSQLRPIQKFIPSLNKESLLINLKLSVKIINTSFSQLSFVGYLKIMPKQIIDEGYGFLIYQISSLKVIGFDLQFKKIINHKITGQQIVQGNIKLASILPKINPLLLSNQICLRTMMEIGGSTQDQENKYKNNVHVESQLITVFDKIKIGILKIQQIKQIKQNDHNIKIKRKRLQFIQQNELIMNQTAIIQKSKQILPLQQTIKQQLQYQQKHTLKKIANLIYMITCLTCTLLLIYMFLSHRTNLDQISKMQEQFHVIAQLQYSMTKINLLSNLLWSIQEKRHQQNYEKWIPIYTQQYNSLRKTVSQIVTITKSYPQNLQYNQQHIYQFYYILGVDQQFLIQQYSATNINIIYMFLTSAGVVVAQQDSNKQIKCYL